MSVTRWLAFLLCLLTLSGCDLPRDGESTTDSVRGRVLRVGVIQEDPEAREVLSRLAAGLEARVEEVHAPTHALLAGLETFELDAVYGRLERESPLLQTVGRSQPYARHLCQVAGASRPPKDDELSQDGVRTEGAEAGLHAAHLGLKLRPESPWLFTLPETPLPDGFVARPLEDPVEFVLALPPGENRWIMTVDQAIVGSQGAP